MLRQAVSSQPSRSWGEIGRSLRRSVLGSGAGFMHPLFELTEILPVPPGDSPFHVRGLYYTRLLEHARSLPGGVDAFFGTLKDERVREFLRQKFAWSTWYDALPTMPCHVALARVRGLDFETLTKERGRLAGKAIIPSMFRALLALASPQAMAQHIPRVLMANFDFMRTDVSRVLDDKGIGEGHAIPLVIAPSVILTVLGFTEGALELAGYSDVSSSYSDVTPDGQVHGFDTVATRLEFSWGQRL
jgi:hypothetical protein